MSALTADTITDDQIRKLRVQLGSETYAGASNDATDCHVALAAPVGSLRRVQARARCAEILNARNEPRLNGLTRANLEAQLASAIERKCWWAEDAIRADLRAFDEMLGEGKQKSS